MKPLSKIAAGVSPSATLAVSALAKKMKAEGKDVIGFGAGEPDFATPDRISYAGVRAICDGKTRYTPAAGMIELRQAICDRVKADYGLEYEPTQAVVASGAKHTVYIALGALVDPGDEVIVPSPYWVSYCEMVRLFGGVPVVVDVSEEQGFQLEAAITDKTKAIILNNPSNPTGAVYSKEALKAVADVCVKHDLYIISDEIYDKLVYDGVQFTSVAALSDEIKAHTILINGVSKTYAMTGWRIGYALSPAPVAKAMTNYLSHSTGAPGTMCQCAAIEALTVPQDEADAAGVRAAPRFDRQPHQCDALRELPEAERRVLCHGESREGHRKADRRSDHPQRRRFCKASAGEVSGRGRTRHRLRRAELHAPELCDLDREHRDRYGPSGSIFEPASVKPIFETRGAPRVSFLMRG